MPPSPSRLRSSRNGNTHMAPDNSFDFWNAPVPDGIAGLIKRPRYDETFDVSAMMREAGYPGTFRLPKCIRVVKKRLDKIPRPCEEVVNAGSFRGHRDYLEFLAREGHQEGKPFTNPYSYQTDAQYEDNADNLLAANSTFSLCDDKDGVVESVKNQYDSRTSSVVDRTRVVASMSDTPLYQSPQIPQVSASSTSSSAHVMTLGSKSTYDSYTVPTRTSWPQNQTTAVPPSYIDISEFDATLGYNLPSIADTVTSHVSSDAIHNVSNGAIVNQQEINSGTMPVSPLDNLGDFFLDNTRDQGSFPTSSYHSDCDVDYGYESGELYSSMLSRSAYQPQCDQAVLRTAAGGECVEVVDYGHRMDYKYLHGQHKSLFNYKQ